MEREYEIDYIIKLDNSEIAEISNSTVGGFEGDNELHEAHLLRPEEFHFRQMIE